MVSKIKTLPQQEKKGAPEKEDRETLADSPLAGLSDAAVKKLIRSAKKRGYVTHDRINSVLPSDEVNSEQIKDVLAIFSEMGVNVVETEETSKEGEREEGEEPREEADEEARSESCELVEVQQKVPAKSEAKEPTERTDDPVRKGQAAGCPAGSRDRPSPAYNGPVVRGFCRSCRRAGCTGSAAVRHDFHQH